MLQHSEQKKKKTNRTELWNWLKLSVLPTKAATIKRNVRICVYVCVQTVCNSKKPTTIAEQNQAERKNIKEEIQNKIKWTKIHFDYSGSECKQNEKKNAHKNTTTTRLKKTTGNNKWSTEKQNKTKQIRNQRHTTKNNVSTNEQNGGGSKKKLSKENCLS